MPSLPISPDGRQVAYGWSKKDGRAELRVIGLDGSEPRILYSNDELWQIHPKDWFPDGKHVLATFFSKDRVGRQIVLASIADGSVQVLKKFNREWFSEQELSFAPDGRYIAYDLPVQEGSAQRDIFLLAINGGREVRLVKHRADDRLLGWTPDGKAVLISSDRTGSIGAWLIRVVEEKRGSPQLVKANIDLLAEGLGFVQDGSYYYGVQSCTNDLYLTALDPETGKLESPQKLVAQIACGSSAEWSPDGQYLAYAFGHGRELYSLALAIRFMETGRERRLSLRMLRFGGHAFQPHWSPDARLVLAQGRDERFRQGAYRIDAQTGRVTALTRKPEGSKAFEDVIEWPVWSPDGGLIFARWTTEAYPAPRIIVRREFESGQEKELYRSAAPAGVYHLAVSPNAKWAAFVWSDARAGKAALMRGPASGTEARELVKLPRPKLAFGQPIVELAWTPDSRYIIYAPTVASHRGFDFWRISVEGAQPEQIGVRMEGLLPFGLSIHPDGRRIAFSAGKAGQSEVWVLRDFLPR